MRHIILTPNPDNKYKVAILIKDSSFFKPELKIHYIQPLIRLGLKEEDIIVFNLEYDKKKVSAKFAKEYLSTLYKALEALDTKYLLIADSEYFKYACKLTKVSGQIGYVRSIEGKFDAILTYNYSSLFHNPTFQDQITISLKTLANTIQGIHVELGHDVVHSANYPSTIKDISDALDTLSAQKEISCDIETRSLKFYEAGIETIAFGLDKHSGTAFCVEKDNTPEVAKEIKSLLKGFFIRYQGKIIGHNLGYDLKVILYVLWMKEDIDNYIGLLAGLDILTRNIHDTTVIAYLALNSTAGNSLSLKELSHSYMGNYAVDVKDSTLIQSDVLLEYNLKDCLATWFVMDKYYPIMKQDNQERIYTKIMLPSIKTVINMELNGMPIDLSQVSKTEKELQSMLRIAEDSLQNPVIWDFEDKLRVTAREEANAKLKKKIHPLQHFVDVVFNPGSGKHKISLLYDYMNLPVLDYTDTKLPATGGDTLKKLLNHTDNEDYKNIIKAIVEITGIEKILSTFIKAFYKNSVIHKDGSHTLHGNFNLTGTVSSRLSSNSPNLQNLPSNSEYAKPVKKCFKGNGTWLMVGADFSSLEDRISALLTKDKNKLKVYIDGWDAHSLRAKAYFGDEMPDIDQATDNDQCFKANVGSTEICFKAADIIKYKGCTYTGIDFYEKITSGRI